MKQSLRAATALAAFVRRSATAPARILWRDHLRVGLGAQWIGLAGYRRGWKPALAYREVIPLDGPAGEVPWQHAVDALAEALEAVGRSRPTVTVVLSNQFVRYAVLPWSAALKSHAEWLAFARHRYLAVHGPVAEGWTIRVAPALRERPRIASAVDSALIAALKEKINACASLVSVQPYLMVAYNRAQAAIAQQTCWLAIEEPDRLTLALVDRGMWRAIRIRRKEHDWHTTLPLLLDRESALIGLDEPCTEVAVCTYLPFDEKTQGAYRLRDLTFAPGRTGADGQLAMALE